MAAADYSILWVLFLLSCVILYANLRPANVAYSWFPRRPIWTFSLMPIHKVVEQGYNQVTKPSGSPFVVTWWARDYIILPPKYLDDVKGADPQHLSFFDNINEALYLHNSVGDLYTAESSRRMVEVVSKGLNPNIPSLIPVVAEEVEHAYQCLLGPASGWKSVKAMEFFGEIAHRVATRVLIGEELCRNEMFIRQSMSFLQSIFVTALVIAKLPLGPLRNLLASPIGFLHRRKQMRCLERVRSLVNVRLTDHDVHSDVTKMDAIQWTLSMFPNDNVNNSTDQLATELLQNLWAGSSAPGGMMTEIVWQILMHPQELNDLRVEAGEALTQHGWTGKLLSALPKQDSFIRETNRLHPTGSITCARTVMKQPFRFSDGLTLPPGTRIGFPAQAIQHDRDNHDSDAETDHRKPASSVDKTYLPWGYGNHVCPGRFFAVAMMKIAITKLILEYDIEWNRKSNDRPVPVHVEGQFVPNMQQTIQLRKRPTEVLTSIA